MRGSDPGSNKKLKKIVRRARRSTARAAGQKVLWSKAEPMNCSEVLVEQARLTKAQNNATHVFVYQTLLGPPETDGAQAIFTVVNP